MVDPSCIGLSGISVSFDVWVQAGLAEVFES